MASPLAFILWHRAAPSVPETAYQAALEAFHTALKNAPPEGMVATESLGFDRLPWMESGAIVYQDWYLVRDFSALGVLNAAAVAGQRRDPHDAVATLSADGFGGVYALQAGDPLSPDNTVFHWLWKPPGRLTAHYLETLEDTARRTGGSLWRRQLNLGIAPEYCLRCPAEVAAPGLIHVVQPRHIKRFHPCGDRQPIQ